ncbi:hypothetical protein ACJMK2_007615 [Sinanodonta woodiana]|uniref:Protein quiver n=1 Tax=Sinanodonta woodiana TaxID=1069815 RepID=A0ABD3VJ26_SINWO
MTSYRNIRAITKIYVVLCLLGSFEQVASLMCYFCAGTGSKSLCPDAGYFLDGFKDTDGNSEMFKNCMAPFNNSCIIEEYRAGGDIVSYIRDCSDSPPYANPAKEPVYDTLRSEVNTPRNRTSCIFNNIDRVCLTICNTDFCNGPHHEAPWRYQSQIQGILNTLIGTLLTQ